jgi:hypothetical protein
MPDSYLPSVALTGVWLLNQESLTALDTIIDKQRKEIAELRDRRLNTDLSTFKETAAKWTWLKEGELDTKVDGPAKSVVAVAHHFIARGEFQMRDTA